MNMKSIFGVFIFWVLLFSSYISAAPVNLDKIVAVVNTDVITQNELDKRISLMKKRGETSTSSIRQKALDELIDVSLQLQIAKRAGIQIGEKEIDSMVANIAKINSITIAQLKEGLLEKEGIAFNEFRKQMREQGLISRVQQQALGRDIVVGEKEIAKVLSHPPKIDSRPTQYHVIDILIEMPDDTPGDQRAVIAKLANEMAAKLGKGVDVDKAVEDAQKKFKEQIVQKNDLGWRKANEFPGLFEKEIVKMKVNQVAGPLQAPNGVHLLKLLEIHGPDPQKGKFTKEQAAELLYYQKLTEKIKPWLEELRANAYIKITK